MRSTIMLRSNSANAESIVNISFPWAVVLSRHSVRDIKHMPKDWNVFVSGSWVKARRTGTFPTNVQLEEKEAANTLKKGTATGTTPSVRTAVSESGNHLIGLSILHSREGR
jgi:hypothetical protein